MIWLPVSGICNVCTDADAYDCTRELYGHRTRVSTGSWIWEKKKKKKRKKKKRKKKTAAPGIRTCVNIAPSFSARPTELSPFLCISKMELSRRDFRGPDHFALRPQKRGGLLGTGTGGEGDERVKAQLPCLGRVTKTMSVALLLRNNSKRKKSNFRSPAPPPYSWSLLG